MTPTLMVSSTFFDLRQVRADLGEFLTEQLGYRVLMSEYPSFPVDPDMDTVENCRRRVEHDADILVLIVGGRYGSIDFKSSKSVTNIEYLAARKKGVPVYAFVERKILDLLPVWHDNPDGDFSRTVDTPQLFEFVEGIRSQERVWTFPFERAQDIVQTLRHQLASLMSNLLELRARLNWRGTPDYFSKLHAESLRIALEQPLGWEYLLFYQKWIDEAALLGDLTREYHSGFRLGFSEHVRSAEAVDWFETRMHEFLELIATANYLVNEAAPDAFGPPGTPGDPEKIIWVASTMSRTLKMALEWAILVRRARVEQPWTQVATELAKTPTELIAELQDFPRRAMKDLAAAIAIASDDSPQILTPTIEFRFSNEEALNAAIESVRRGSAKAPG